MLPRKHALSLRKESKRLYQAGHTYQSPLLSLQVVGGDDDQAVTKCSFVISKKVDKRSVGRHRLTRLLADVLAPYIDSMPVVILVIVGKPPLSKASNEEITFALTTLLQQAKLI